MQTALQFHGASQIPAGTSTHTHQCTIYHSRVLRTSVRSTGSGMGSVAGNHISKPSKETSITTDSLLDAAIADKSRRNKDSSASQARIESITNGLVERLKVEAGERAVLQQQLAEAQASVMAAAVAAEGSAAQVESLQAERAMLVEKAEVQGANLAMLESKLKRQAREVEALQSEVQASLTARDILLSERQQLQSQVQALQQANVAQQKEADQQLAGLQQQLAGLQQSLAASKEREEAAAAQQAVVVQQLQDTQAELSAVQSQQQAVIQEFNQLKGSLEAQLAATTAELHASQKKQLTMVDQEKIQGLQQELKVALEDKRSMSRQYTQAQELAQSLSKQLETAGNSQVSLQQHVSNLEAQLVEVQNQLGATRVQLSKLEDELAVAQASEAAAKEVATQQRNDIEIAAMSKQMRILSMQMESSERERHLEVSVLATNYWNAAQQAADAMSAAQALQQQVHTLTAANQQLQLELQQREDNAVKAQKAQETASHLTSQVEQLQGRVDVLEVEGKAHAQQAKEARDAEALAKQELSGVQHKLATTEAWVSQRAAAAQAMKQRATHNTTAGGSMPQGYHQSINRYWTPPGGLFELVKSLAVREATLKEAADGFIGMEVEVKGEQVVVVTVWESNAAFEGWHAKRQSETLMAGLPVGVMQYPVEKKGEGIPESHLPIKSS